MKNKEKPTYIAPRDYTDNSQLLGKYINRSLYTDVDPVGKIIATRGTNFVTIQPVVAGENQVKMDFIRGGFSFHCTNNWNQKYEFTEIGEPYEIRLSKSMMKNNFYVIQDHPSKHYDYNF